MAESRREQSHVYLRATRMDDDTRHNVHFEDLLKTIQTQLTSLNEEVQVLKKQKGNSYFPGRRSHNPKRFNNARRDSTKQGRSRDDIICFNCNKKGQIAKNCGVGPRPKPKEEDGKAHLNTSCASKNGKNMNGAVGVNRLAAESGMFVKAKVTGLEVNLLVDTGATVTLISRKLYERMKDPVKTQMNRDIYSAGGEKLNIFGKTVVDVEIGKWLASSVAVIADISIDGILGLDFQKSQYCVIDVGRGIMKMKGFDIQLSFEGNIGCYNVTVAETVTLPPRTENIVRGKVKDKCCSLNGASLVEPNTTIKDADTILLGRSLVENVEAIPLRIMNVTNTPKVIQEGTVIGSISTVDEVFSTSAEATDMTEEMPDHMRGLYEDTTKNLTRDQSKKVEKLLLKYASVFAKSDFDLGRTNIIKHIIETQDARPHREPPRRVPFHQQSDMDKAIDNMLAKDVIEPSTSLWSDGMVERFNRTLEIMLSNYVKENHRDWDRQLPYIMMAYRSAEHETTSFTPNMLMLGRETTMPLDLVYEMPSSIKTISPNRWVWELQERLEQAHDLVRKYSKGSILRQKMYHDRKVAWERFEIGDQVYVYFPVKKVGCSPKLTSFWRGPFEVKRKVSEVLYEINCGRDDTNSVIHCDRVRKKVEQRLSWETEDHDRRESDNEDVVIDNDDDYEDMTQEYSRPRREIKRPARFDDYICE